MIILILNPAKSLYLAIIKHVCNPVLWGRKTEKKTNLNSTL